MADSEKALDTWMREALTDAYGGVADERLPDSWLRMLDGPSDE